MIVSRQQQQSNRENAKHSTGPKSAEGKEKVRFNAFKHGLRSNFLITPGEDPAEFEALCASLIADWNPQDTTEHHLVEQMAVAKWKIGRAERYTQRLYTMDLDVNQMKDMLNNPMMQTRHHERSFDQAMRGLLHLRKQRKALEAQPPKQQRNEVRSQASTTEPQQSPAAPPAEPAMPQYVMSAHAASDTR